MNTIIIEKEQHEKDCEEWIQNGKIIRSGGLTENVPKNN